MMRQLLKYRQPIQCEKFDNTTASFRWDLLFYKAFWLLSSKNEFNCLSQEELSLSRSQRHLYTGKLLNGNIKPIVTDLGMLEVLNRFVMSCPCDGITEHVRNQPIRDKSPPIILYSLIPVLGRFYKGSAWQYYKITQIVIPGLISQPAKLGMSLILHRLGSVWQGRLGWCGLGNKSWIL